MVHMMVALLVLLVVVLVAVSMLVLAMTRTLVMSHCAVCCARSSLGLSVQVLKAAKISAMLARFQRGGGNSREMTPNSSATRIVMGRAVESKPSPDARLQLSRGFHSDRYA